MVQIKSKECFQLEINDKDQDGILDQGEISLKSLQKKEPARFKWELPNPNQCADSTIQEALKDQYAISDQTKLYGKSIHQVRNYFGTFRKLDDLKLNIFQSEGNRLDYYDPKGIEEKLPKALELYDKVLSQADSLGIEKSSIQAHFKENFSGAYRGKLRDYFHQHIFKTSVGKIDFSKDQIVKQLVDIGKLLGKTNDQVMKELNHPDTIKKFGKPEAEKHLELIKKFAKFGWKPTEKVIKTYQRICELSGISLDPGFGELKTTYEKASYINQDFGNFNTYVRGFNENCKYILANKDQFNFSFSRNSDGKHVFTVTAKNSKDVDKNFSFVEKDRVSFVVHSQDLNFWANKPEKIIDGPPLKHGHDQVVKDLYSYLTQISQIAFGI